MSEQYAFPTASENPFAPKGMTMLDYFAAKAMQGILSHPKCLPVVDSDIAELAAEEAFRVAAAMLKAREAK